MFKDFSSLLQISLMCFWCMWDSCVMLSENITLLLSLFEDAVWFKDMCAYTRLTKGGF